MYFAHNNPYEYLNLEGKVRAHHHEAVSFYTAEDIARFLCDEKTAEATITELKQMLADGHNPFSLIPNGGAFKELGELLLEDENVYDFIASLPGERAKEFTDILDDYERREHSRAAFIRANSAEWERRGQRYKVVRKALGLSLSSIAGKLRISPSTLGDFEKGYPLRRADQIESAYGIFLELAILRQKEEGVYVLLDQARNPWNYGLEEDDLV